MESLSEEEQDAIRILYKNTLPGAVVAYLKLHEEVPLEDLLKFVSENYPKFRNVSGCKYKGKSIRKVIQGLVSHPAYLIRSDFISLNPILIDEYEQKRMDSIAIQRKKTRIKIKLAPDISTNKTADLIFMIENFCGQISRDHDFVKIFDEPFKKIKVGDSFEDAGVKVGFERLIGMIQGFEITSRYFSEINKKELLEKYHSRIMVKALNHIERRLDKLEALKELFSERTGSST